MRVKISENLTPVEMRKITELLEEFKEVFSYIPGRTKAIENKIVLTKDTPVRVKLYPIPLHFRNQVNEEILELIRIGMIEESDTE